MSRQEFGEIGTAALLAQEPFILVKDDKLAYFSTGTAFVFVDWHCFLLCTVILAAVLFIVVMAWVW